MSGMQQNIRDQSFQETVDHIHIFMPCMDYTEMSPLQKTQKNALNVFKLILLIK